MENKWKRKSGSNGKAIEPAGLVKRCPLTWLFKQKKWKHPNEKGHEITDGIVITKVEGKSSISSPAIITLPGSFCSLLVRKHGHLLKYSNAAANEMCSHTVKASGPLQPQRAPVP